MIGDLQQDVEILGKVFHFRTRLVDPSGLVISTEVLLGGKVVATRESEYGSHQSVDRELAHAWMSEQHKRVFEMFVARALRYQYRDQLAADAQPPPTESVPDLAPRAGRAEPEAGAPPSAPPSVQESSSLHEALRVRRFFGSFAKLMNISTRVSVEEIVPRLESAARTFDWMAESDSFADIRIDEQVRCHLLRTRIDEWLEAGADPNTGKRIWAEIVQFNNYLSEINHRVLLMEFDHRMLTWALGEVRRHGMTDEVLRQLGWLYGLLPQLSRWLDHPDEVSDEAWVTELTLALTLTDPQATDGVAPTLPREPSAHH